MNENVSHSLIKVANQMFFQHLITRPSNVLPVSAAATLALFSSFSVAQEADKSLVAFDPIVVTATRMSSDNRTDPQIDIKNDPLVRVGYLLQETA